MYPLIEIKTVPIEIEMKTTDAQWKYVRGSADLEISRDKGGMKIKSRPVKVNIDTFEARNSVVPTPARSIANNAQEGHQAAYEATAAYARQGQLLLNTRIGEELVTKFASEAMTKDLKTNVGIKFIPTTGPEITWTPAEMNIRYEMDKLNFDWRMNKAQFEFTPGDIEISVKQRPEIHIEYVGGPLYVPPSADPSYEPPEDGKGLEAQV